MHTFTRSHIRFFKKYLYVLYQTWLDRRIFITRFSCIDRTECDLCMESKEISDYLIRFISVSSLSIACLTGLTGLFTPGAGCFNSKIQLHIMIRSPQTSFKISIFKKISILCFQLFLVNLARSRYRGSLFCVRGRRGRIKKRYNFSHGSLHASIGWIRTASYDSRVRHWVTPDSGIYFRLVTLGPLSLGYQ